MLGDKQRRGRVGAWWRKDGRGNGTHDVGMIDALEHPHLAPYDLLISLDLLLRHGLQYDLACDVVQAEELRTGLRRAEWRGKS